MKLNCLIVDDEPLARKVLEEYIEDIESGIDSPNLRVNLIRTIDTIAEIIRGKKKYW